MTTNTSTPPDPRRRPRAVVGVVAAALAVGLLASCAAGTPDDSADAGTPVAGGTLVYARPASVTSLDLHNQITSNNAFAIDKIFEPLVAFDETGAIIPWLAESHEVSDDGLIYTFTLQEGLLFSDGTPVTSADVKFSLERHLEVGGPLPIGGDVTGIETPDDLTVVITLGTAYTPFLAELSGFSNGVVPADFGGLGEEEFFAAPVGTGPFVVSEWDPAGDITFAKNENYWQDGKPFIESLVYSLVADDTQGLQQLQAGQVQALETVPASNVAELEANAAVTVVTAGSWVTEQVFFNTQNEYFADEHVRRAIALALDREGLNAATTFGTAEVADALLPPTIEYSGSGIIDALDLDLDAAKAELAESAYPTGFEATILIASGNTARAQEAQVIQAAAAEIGITLQIEAIDLAAFRERFFAYDFDLMINSGQSDSPDPNGFITFQTDPEGFSQSYWTHYTNERVTELAIEGRSAPAGDEREAIYLEIQQILADDVPYIPLFYPSTIRATGADVHDLTVLPNGSIRFEDAWLEASE
jgi:peptide/nickel transport system substrate-binding protein